MGLILVGMIFFVVVGVVLVHAIFEFFHSLAALRHNVGPMRMGWRHMS